MEQQLANLHLPSFIRSITASCITSVYISNAGMSGLEPRLPQYGIGNVTHTRLYR